MNEFDDLEDFYDGDNAKYIAERDRILAEFEEFLMNGNQESDYDLYDWIMIADYAMDVDNSFLLNEAISRGMRAYPDSPELRDRQLLLYAQTLNEEETRKAFMAAYNAGAPSKMVCLYKTYYDWLDLPKKSATSKRGYKEISEVAFDGEKLFDIEIIEIVKILSWMGAIRYFAKDIAKWESHVHNTEMLWYEVMTEALTCGEHQLAETLADKLVAEYPYNCLYWMMKAQSIISRSLREKCVDKDIVLPRLDEVLTILETVLAINPDDEKAKALKDKTVNMRQMIESGQLDLDADDEENLTFNYDRQPWDLMTLMELRALLDSPDPAAEDLIDAWLHFQTAMLADRDQCRNPENINVVALIETLYMLRYGDEVDYLLSRINAITDIEFQELMPVRVLRLLQNGHPIEATELFTKIDTMSDAFEGMNPTKFLLSIIIEKYIGLRDEAIEISGQFVPQMVQYRLQDNAYKGNIFEHVNPCVLDYFISNFVYSN